MRRLLVEKETTVPQASPFGIRSFDKSDRLLGLLLGVKRRYRYTKMVERIYGKPEAANQLLLKTLYLSQLMDTPAGQIPDHSSLTID